MGSKIGYESEKPIHYVTVSDFYIGKYEVTQKLWKEIMGNTPSHNKNCDDCPVESVSWNDAQEFIKKLNAKTGKNYCLPSEAEWEFAAGGGNKSKEYMYAGSNNISKFAWYDENSNETHPVGQKKPNKLGIYDMSGNVWEWCQDNWHKNYKLAPNNSFAWESNKNSDRVIRSGSWDNWAYISRITNRSNRLPSEKDFDIGFRLSRK